MRLRFTTGVVALASSVVLVACGSSGGDEVTAPNTLTVGTTDSSYELAWDGDAETTVFAALSPTHPSVDGEQVASTDDGTATITDLNPDLRWYFQTSTDGNEGPIASTRQFALDGAHNVRDIGGYPASDGRTVAWGQVFRGSDLSELTQRDTTALEAADVLTIVDFRGEDEIASSGADPVTDAMTLVNVPLLDETTQALAEAITEAMSSGDPEIMEELLGNGRGKQIADEGFVNQLDKPETMAGYAQTIRAIAESDDALLYHCTAGKDRTGMMTALLLGILGVDDETIIDDFVLSNEYNREHNDQTYAFLADQGVDVDLIRPLTEQEPSNIKPVLDAVHNDHGGWEQFARTVLDLDQDTIDALRDKMLVD